MWLYHNEANLPQPIINWITRTTKPNKNKLTIDITYILWDPVKKPDFKGKGVGWTSAISVQGLHVEHMVEILCDAKVHHAIMC